MSDSTADISGRYALPRYYIPASLQTTGYLFILDNTRVETAKDAVDSLLESGQPIKVVRIYTEIGVENDIIAEIETYCQEHHDLDIEDIHVFKLLTSWEIISVTAHLKRETTYREALYN